MYRLICAVCHAVGILSLAAPTGAATLVAFDSEPGEPTLEGQDAVLGPPDFEFLAVEYVPTQGHMILRLRRVEDPTDNILFEFRTIDGATFVGPTHVAVEHPAGAANPYLRVVHAAEPCASPGEGEGAFRVIEASDEINTLPERLAVDFQYRCPGATGVLRGAIRIGSDVPVTPTLPVAVASGPTYASEGEVVELDGRWSWKGPAAITSYAWQQLSGPAVTLANAATAQPTFVAAADAGVISPLVFELTVTDASGNASAGTVTVNVYDEAVPQTYLALQSEPGEHILDGISYLYRSPDVDLDWRFIEGGQSAVAATVVPVEVLFTGRSDVPLQPDIYLDAVRFGQQPATKPGLTLSGFARDCTGELGWFVVHEIEVDDGAGLITKLAMDFERRCTAGPDSPARAFGQLRINSTVPRTRAAPLAIAGQDIRAFELEEVTLDGGRSQPGAHPIDRWRWTQVTGPEVVIEDPTLPLVRFTTPAIPAGSVDFEFELEVTDTVGQVDIDSVRVTALSLAAPRNLLRIDGRLGDHIGRGVYKTFEEEDGLFLLEFQDDNGLVATFQGGPDASYGLTVRAPEGQALVAGNFEDADRGSGDSPLRPLIDVNSFGHACSSSAGRFVIHEIVRDPGNGDVERLAIDFVHYCDPPSGDPPLFGGLRYQSSVPLDLSAPTAAAGADQIALERETIVLDGRNTMPGSAPIDQWRWRQVSGPAVALAEPGESITTFTAPAVAPPGETLGFELRTVNGDGHEDTDETQVYVQHKRSPRSVVFLTGDGTDRLRPAGRQLVLQPQDGLFEIREFGLGQAQAYLEWRGVGYDWLFNVFTDQPLAVGEYEVDSERALYPTIDIVANATSCTIQRGPFWIRDIAFTGERVERLALDFEQYCESFGIPLLGKIRFNVEIPDANAGPDLEAVGRTAVTLSSALSEPAVGTLQRYSWRQVAGPTVVMQGTDTASAAFTAPDVAAATSMTFELTVFDDRGIDDSDFVSVRVTPGSTPPPSPPPPPSDGGDAGGGGGGGTTGWLSIAALLMLRLSASSRRLRRKCKRCDRNGHPWEGTPSLRKCYLCPRNKVLPMCPVWT